jgi:hypothetical protein
MASIRPGKRRWSSSQRLTLRISTPRRSLRINPASLSTLKCWDSVDFGMHWSVIWRKFEQVVAEEEAANPA